MGPNNTRTFLYQGGIGISSQINTQGSNLVHAHPMSLDEHDMGVGNCSRGCQWARPHLGETGLGIRETMNLSYPEYVKRRDANLCWWSFWSKP